MISRTLRTAAAATLAIALSFAGAASASADTSDFTFDSFDAQYTLSMEDDGTSHLEVVETIVARFPNFDQNRGILRAIPEVVQSTATEPTVHSVVDENGTDVYWEESNDGEYLVLALGTDDFVYGKTTYVISYSLENVVLPFTDPEPADEFYWDVNGTGFDQPFGTVSATIVVDESAASALDGYTACYYGAFQSDSTCTLTQTGSTFSTSVSNLGKQENVSFAIGFAPGTFVQGPEYDGEGYQYNPGISQGLNPAPWWGDLISALFALGAIATVVFAAIARGAKRKSVAGRGIIVPQYAVPKGINVMVASHIVDREQTAFSAQLVSLAVRKKLRILDYPVTASGAEYTLQYLNADELDETELELMQALFGGKLDEGEVKELAPNDVTLGNAVRAVTAKAGTEVQRLGLRDKPTVGLGCLFPGIAFALFFLSIVAGIMISAATMSFSFWTIGAGFVSFIALVCTIVMLIGNGKGALTAPGVEWRDYLLGMKMYLELAEKERFRLLQSPENAERIDVGDTKQIIKLYEKLLPFAVLWGVEDEWMRELVVHAGVNETPDWFMSNNGFNPSSFTNAVRGASAAATYAAPAASSSSSGTSWGGIGSSGSSWSSSSGGSRGGGFSGGGGGGGGGGGR